MSIKDRINTALIANRNAQDLGEMVDTSKEIHKLLDEAEAIESELARYKAIAEGIQSRYPTRTCRGCGNVFQPTDPRTISCSAKCKQRVWRKTQKEKQ